MHTITKVEIGGSPYHEETRIFIKNEETEQNGEIYITRMYGTGCDNFFLNGIFQTTVENFDWNTDEFVKQTFILTKRI